MESVSTRSCDCVWYVECLCLWVESDKERAYFHVWECLFSFVPFLETTQEIVRCFTTESSDNRLKPLTYQDVVQQKQQSGGGGDSTVQSTSSIPSTSERPTLTREHSIELKTPGLGSGDGFIHTTLCRLPLDCLSQNDVSLAQVHRLCRELTASMSGELLLLLLLLLCVSQWLILYKSNLCLCGACKGHRLVVSKFRFLETTGRGGLVCSNSMHRFYPFLL